MSPVRTGRPPSADWPSVLSQARRLHERKPRPIRELFLSLAAAGVLEPTDTHWSGFRYKVAEAQKCGEFPKLPAAKRGPTKGTHWTEARWEAERALSAVGGDGPSPHEMLTRRIAACRSYLHGALVESGRIDLTPKLMRRLASDGWGGGVVGQAITDLVQLEQAALGRRSNGGVSLVRVEH